jgi:hypothetical protein
VESSETIVTVVRVQGTRHPELVGVDHENGMEAHVRLGCFVPMVTLNLRHALNENEKNQKML